MSTARSSAKEISSIPSLRVIRQWMFNDVDADRAQHGKESLRIADGRDRVHGLAGELAQRLGCAIFHRDRAGCQQSHAQRAVALRISAIQYDGVRTPETRRCLAQRAGGQQAPVAEASIAVDDDDFAVPLQSIVLQSIVADDDVAARIDQQLCRRGTIAPVATGTRLRRASKMASSPTLSELSEA